MKKVLFELLAIPLTLLISVAFAWIPMLCWNLGVRAAFPHLPIIGYWDAFWFSAGLSYLKTSIVPIKD